MGKEVGVNRLNQLALGSRLITLCAKKKSMIWEGAGVGSFG